MLQPQGRPVRGPNGERGMQLPSGEIIVLDDPVAAPAVPPMRQVIPPRPDLPPAQTPEQARGVTLNNERTAQEIEAHGKLPPVEKGKLVERWKLLPSFEQSVNELETLFAQKVGGPDKGGILGIGGERNIAGYLPGFAHPDNQTLAAKADSLIGTIASIQGLTGGEMNSLAELRARFGPMLPQPSDNDETIKQKLAGLRAMTQAQRQAIAAQLPELTAEPAVQAAPAAAPPAPPPIGGEMDATQQRVMDPSGADVGLATGDTQTVKDPALAALNARVNEMLKTGEPIAKVRQLITEAGVPYREVAASLREAARFRKANPGYQGDWDVRLDESQIPLEGVRQAAAIASAGPIGAAGIAAGNIVTGNHLDNLVEAGGGSGELANIGMQAVRQQNPYSSLVGDVAGGGSLYGAGRAVAARIPSLLGGGTNALLAPAGDAAMGAFIGSGGNGTDLVSPSGMAAGAGLGVAGGIAGRAGINALGRAISPTGGKLAPVYAEGVRPTLGQRMGGAMGRFEEAHNVLPVVGAIPRNARNQALDQAQRGGFNVALREIDDELPKHIVKGTQAHAYMQRAFNSIYDKARSGLTFKPDGTFGQEFGAVLRDVDLLPPQSQNTFKQLAMQVGHRTNARGGMLPGDDYKMLVSRITAKARAIRKNPSGDAELADALERFALALDDSARRNSPPEAAELLNKADRGYVKSVILENASKGAGAAGEYSGASLENAVKSGAGGIRSRVFLRGEAPMQDYAAAMKQMGDVVPDSGTIPRLMATGGAGAVGGLVHPAALIPSAASIASNLPGIRRGIHAAIAPNRKRLAPVRKAIIDRAKLGSLFGVPLVEAQSQ